MFMLAHQSDRSENNIHKLKAFNHYFGGSHTELPANINCQFLNIPLPKHQVTCSHIFQKRWHKERSLIKLGDINDPRNLMFLFKPLEVVFDEGRIIFLWDSASASFKMKILDPNLRWDSGLKRSPTILDLAIRSFPKVQKYLGI